MCRSLLIEDEKLDTFRLSHLSIKEYIEDSNPLGYEEIQIQTTAAETCLLFLDNGNKILRNDLAFKDFTNMLSLTRRVIATWPLRIGMKACWEIFSALLLFCSCARSKHIVQRVAPCSAISAEGPK